MVRQVHPHVSWPSGDRVHLAEIPYSPTVLQHRYGIEFHEDVDDLDRYWLAALELSDGSQVWLERHEGDRVDRTLALVDAHADLKRSLHELTEMLRLSERDLSWVSPLINQQDGESGHAIAMD